MGLSHSMGGGKESARRRALVRAGMDPELAASTAAKEFAPARAKQHDIEAAAAKVKEEKASATSKAEREKRKREKRKLAGDEAAEKRQKVRNSVEVKKDSAAEG